jgi:hypothetical protein
LREKRQQTTNKEEDKDILFKSNQVRRCLRAKAIERPGLKTAPKPPAAEVPLPWKLLRYLCSTSNADGGPWRKAFLRTKPIQVFEVEPDSDLKSEDEVVQDSWKQKRNPWVEEGFLCWRRIELVEV